MQWRGIATEPDDGLGVLSTNSKIAGIVSFQEVFEKMGPRKNISRLLGLVDGAVEAYRILHRYTDVQHIVSNENQYFFARCFHLFYKRGYFSFKFPLIFQNIVKNRKYAGVAMLNGSQLKERCPDLHVFIKAPIFHRSRLVLFIRQSGKGNKQLNGFTNF